MEDIVIIGAGGFAREVAFLIEDINRDCRAWNLLGFIEAEAAATGRSVGKYKVVGTDRFLDDRAEISVVIAIGTPARLQEISERIRTKPGLRLPNLVHPSVIMDRERVQFGNGNIVCAGNILTTDIQVGSFNILNLTCTFGHDLRIGDCNVVNPGANISGGVVVGDGCLIGTGATILQNRVIGSRSVVGAGAVVTKDVPEGQTVVGSPAKPLVAGTS